MKNTEYRCWDKEEKRMYYSYGDKDYLWKIFFSCSDMEVVLMKQTGTHLEMVGIESIEVSEEEEIVLSQEEFELQQFTGLLDKTGKKIFNGDILNDMISETNFEVVWNDYGYWEGIGREYRLIGALGLLDTNRFVVIGNKLENPDMYKEMKEE